MIAYLQQHWIELANLVIAGVGVPVLLYHVSGVHQTIATQNKQIKAQTLVPSTITISISVVRFCTNHT